MVALATFNGNATQPESGWYKIKNVDTEKYVSVKGKYYAKPDATADNATIIYVGVGQRTNNEKEQYKLTSLKGNNVEVYSYIDKAIALANAYVDNVMTSGSNALSPAEVAYAHQLIDQYKNDYGFLYIENGNNATVATETGWKLGVDVPAIPDVVEQMALMHGVTGGVWNWAKAVIYSYLENNSVDPMLVQLVTNNLEKIEPGNTYYLKADDDDTFGYVKGEDDMAQSALCQWQLEAYTPEPGLSGYYRIKNARGLNGRAYVNVTGKFTAHPNLTKEEALTAPGTIHYIGLADRIGDLTQEVTRLSAQGRNANSLAERGIAKIKELACDYVDQIVAEDPSFALYAGFAKNLINNYEVSSSVSVRSTITNAGEDAYYCLYTTPSMETISNLVSTVFAMGLGQNFAAQHPSWFNFDENNVAVSLNEIGFFQSVKEMIKAEVVELGYDQLYPELYQKILKNLDRIKPATTYYLTQDNFATLDYVEEDDLDETDDAAKWIIEPIDEVNYFALVPECSYSKEGKATYFYTTLYTDFAYTLPEGAKAYKVTGIEEKVNTQGKTYYVCTKSELTGQVPAYTPVIIETTSELVENNMLQPVGTPVDAPAATLKISESTSDNILVASFFDEANLGNYRELLSNTTIGFFDVADAIIGNKAYLDADALNPSDASVYYLFDDNNTQSAITTVSASQDIAGVKYVNLAGVESATPFNGMNIVVVTFNDGTTATMKMMK